MAEKTITIIFYPSGRKVKVPRHIYEAFKNVDAKSLLKACAPKVRRGAR